MRASLDDLPEGMARKVDDYPNLPEDLKDSCYYLRDAGYCIMAVPQCLIGEYLNSGKALYNFECPVPVKYVIEKGWDWFRGCVTVDAKYDHDFGLLVEEKYFEY